MSKTYQVLIAGAGPGGCTAARDLARAGLRVRVFEKGTYESIGHNWSDAVERAALETAGFSIPAAGVKNSGPSVKDGKPEGDQLKIFEEHGYPEMDVWAPDYSVSKRISFRYITVDRKMLAMELVRQARAAGAEILFQHEVTGLDVSGDTGSLGTIHVGGITVKGAEGPVQINGDVVIDATGYNAVLRRLLPEASGISGAYPRGDFADVYRTVRKRNNQMHEDLTDHYRYGYKTGYQWVQYLNDAEIDIGAGVRADQNDADSRTIVEEFIGRHPSISSEILRGGSGKCLVGKSPFSLTAGGFTAVGDAAAQSIPMTGCGAGGAMVGGILAAKTVIQAADSGRFDIGSLWPYNRMWFIDSGRGMNYAALTALRNSLQVLRHEDISFLFQKDILNASLLTESINGSYMPADFITKLRTLIHGIGRPGLLAQLSKAVTAADEIYRHYSGYPPEWDPERFSVWKNKAEVLFGKLPG